MTTHLIELLHLLPADVAAEPLGVPSWVVTLLALLGTAAIAAVWRGLQLLAKRIGNETLTAVLEKATVYALPVVQQVWRDFARECKARSEDGKLTGPEAAEAARRALTLLREHMADGDLGKVDDRLLKGVLEKELQKAKSLSLNTAKEKRKTQETVVL